MKDQLIDQQLNRFAAAVADASPDPTPMLTPGTRRRTARPVVAFAGAFAVVALTIGITVVLPSVAPPDTDAADVSGSATISVSPPRSAEEQTSTTVVAETPVTVAPVIGFSVDAAAAMPVVPAKYGFDIDEWMTTMAYGGGSLHEFPAADINDALVTAVRGAASEALASIGARPPYEAEVIQAALGPATEAWNGVMSVSHGDGECLVVVVKSLHIYGACPGSGDAEPKTLLLGFSESSLGGLFEPATASVGDTVQLIWWGLPNNVVDILYWRDAGEGVEPDISATAVLGRTAWIFRDVAGVEQPIRVLARDDEGAVVVEDTLTIPAPRADVSHATTTVEYDMDAVRFVDMLRGETFLGGGTVLGERWAIVGRTMVEPGKEPLQCVGVRPIRDEDSCGVGDFLSWQVLPVGNGGVVVFNGPKDASRVRVVFGDGRVVDVPFAGLREGYPPIAVISVERIGEKGTAYAMTETGDILYSEDFEVSSFADPKG